MNINLNSYAKNYLQATYFKLQIWSERCLLIMHLIPDKLNPLWIPGAASSDL